LNSLGVQTFLLYLPILAFSIVAHEVAHGYAALRQGDDTALMLGRLTFNPLKHVDPFMTVILPLVLVLSGNVALAGAKPVPVNPRKYRHFKRGDIIVSLAGIATNLLLAIICTVLIIAIGRIPVIESAAQTQTLLQAMMGWGVELNLLLAMFNLIPIPPLDGSHVLKYLLPPGWAYGFQRMGFYGLFIIYFLMRGGLLNWWLTPAARVAEGLLRLAASLGPLFGSPLAPWGDA
jgi:Zn-dependent protease